MVDLSALDEIEDDEPLLPSEEDMLAMEEEILEAQAEFEEAEAVLEAEADEIIEVIEAEHPPYRTVRPASAEEMVRKEQQEAWDRSA